MLATIRKRDGIDEIPGLVAAGACGFKMSLFDTDPNRFPRIPDDELLRAFAVIADTGQVVMVHAENDEIVRSAIRRLEDRGHDPVAHCHSRPMAAESEAALRAMELAYWTGVPLHLAHTTQARIFHLVEIWRGMGTRVTAETCPHYVVLSEEDMPTLGSRGKINPPLRPAVERDALWPLLRRGLIHSVSSDHAPWPLHRKEHPNIFQNASGRPASRCSCP